MSEVIIENKTTFFSTGRALFTLLNRFKGYFNHKKLVINTNSNTMNEVFLEDMERIDIYDNAALFCSTGSIHDFLNLNNVLSISVVDVYD